MPRILLLAALLLTSAAAAGEPLRVMTFNVRGDFDRGVATDKSDGWLSLEGPHRREAALGVVQAFDPDLVGLQEAYRNQVDEFDAALPGHDAYAVGRDDGASAGEHCALLYRRDRFERLGEGTFWLSHEPDRPSTFPGAACPRIASWLVLRDRSDGGRELLVVNTHWDHVSEEARRHSARLIRERLGALRGGRPAIVMGDLNRPEGSEPFRTLLVEDSADSADRLVDGYRAVWPERQADEATFHAYRGGTEGSRIDFVLHTPGYRTTAAEIVRSAPGGRFPSDHYPVTAVLEPAR